MNTVMAYLIDESEKSIELFVEPIIKDDIQQLIFMDGGKTITDLKAAGLYSQNVQNILLAEAEELDILVDDENLIINPDAAKYQNNEAQAGRLAQLIVTIRRMIFKGYIN